MALTMQRKLVEMQLQQNMDDLLASQAIAHLGTWRMNLATGELTWSDELYRIFGLDPSVPPPSYSEHWRLFTSESWERLSRAFETTRISGIPYELELETIGTDGTHRWVWVKGEAIKDKTGMITGLWGAVQDISDRKKYEQELLHLLTHDHLTGLENRKALENFLQTILLPDPNKKQALISINLSTVYYLSTGYGFEYTQDLIWEIAESLRALCDGECRLFHTYPTRFVLYVTSYPDRTGLDDYCMRISAILQPILTIERVGWGIGVLELNHFSGRSISLLLRDLLISSEKSVERFEETAEVCFFDEGMESVIEREKIITKEMTEIAAGERPDRLFLVFQPILDLSTHKVCGFEALARLESESLGLVPPLEFIPIAEKTKLMLPLGYVIIRKALQFQRILKARGFHDLGVSINISALQIQRDDFLSNLVSLVDELGGDPRHLGLEITESMLVTNFQAINHTLGQLKNLGFHIALDDFGTGYSSFAQARELNIDCLKIDKYFMDKFLELDECDSITGDIISMAHKLGHCVIAEGVEVEEQWRYLVEHGCDKMQGYLISKPLKEDQAIEFLMQRFDEFSVNFIQ